MCEGSAALTRRIGVGAGQDERAIAELLQDFRRADFRYVARLRGRARRNIQFGRYGAGADTQRRGVGDPGRVVDHCVRGGDGPETRHETLLQAQRAGGKRHAAAVAAGIERRAEHQRARSSLAEGTRAAERAHQRQRIRSGVDPGVRRDIDRVGERHGGVGLQDAASQSQRPGAERATVIDVDAAVTQCGAAAIGVGTRQGQRARAGLFQRARRAADDAADGRRCVVTAGGQRLPGADLDGPCTGARSDRFGIDDLQRPPAFNDDGAGIVDRRTVAKPQRALLNPGFTRIGAGAGDLQSARRIDDDAAAPEIDIPDREG